MKEPFAYSIGPYTFGYGFAVVSGWKRSFPCAETVVSRLGTGVLTLETSASMIGK